ncbi:sigma-B regulation protein RsbU (phosphoserine phosphatase) [Flavobacterium sp. 270]|uniref:sensor histidine kinase n=1 Tax=Flavobacterium sp. 270 TaxID=2512114 RepID=UPI0010660B43|nr:ATP-binding protein [Flavobacterium sp. 270]TDW47819.1 sigma-B regulation protein RsbU (phosphoserine phosphatase) [Flavobacterium sp. 270]
MPDINSEHSDSEYHSAPCYLFTFQSDGLITKINDALLHDLKYSREELIRRIKFADIVTAGSRIFFQTQFFPIVKMKGYADEVFLSFIAKDGTDFPVLLNAAYIEKENSFAVHFGGMRISNRNKFEKEILAAKNAAEKALLQNAELISMRNVLLENEKLLSRQLQELADKNSQMTEINKILSHDLQEPLRKISFFSNKVKDDAGKETKINTLYLTKITDLVENTRDLLEGLERYNAIDSKKLTYTEVNLAEIIEYVVKNLPDSLRDLNYEILENSYPFFYADFNMITNLFKELIDNSFKFKKRESKVSINIKAEIITQNILENSNKYHYQNFIRISYEDNGEGFNEQGIKLFEIFRKVDSKEKSIGMGLALCKKIVQRHKGNITVSSREGIGTRFTILLPAENN